MENQQEHAFIPDGDELFRDRFASGGAILKYKGVSREHIVCTMGLRCTGCNVMVDIVYQLVYNGIHN